jgi:hypothetical protein
MTRKLVGRLQDIPGVAAVSVNIEDEGGGINVRLEPNADEAEVLERVRSLLVAYSVRSQAFPPLRVGRTPLSGELGVDVKITPIKGGARVEVIGDAVRSFRVVPPDPTAIAQGLSDAWSQVLGRAPTEISRVSIDDRGHLVVTARLAGAERQGEADLSDGWVAALAQGVGSAIGAFAGTEALADANLPNGAW